jgi:ribosomal protein S27E
VSDKPIDHISPGFGWGTGSKKKATFLVMRKWVECKGCRQPECVDNTDSIVRCSMCGKSIGVAES